jgi:hypothetical protein
MRRFAVILAALWAFPAEAQPISVFGIPLGDNFALPQCADQYPIKVSATCWTYEFPSASGSPATDETHNFRRLHFANPPALGAAINTYVENGVTQFFTMETDGISSQDYVMAQLTSKFGKPSKFEKVRVQNRMGASYEADRAEWSSSQFFVQFDADASDGGGHAGTLDKGWISITTQKRHQEELLRRQKYLNSRQPL